MKRYAEENIRFISRTETPGKILTAVLKARFTPGDKLYILKVPRQYMTGYMRLNIHIIKMFNNGLYTVNDLLANTSDKFILTLVQDTSDYRDWFKPYGTVIEAAIKEPENVGFPFIYLIEDHMNQSRRWHWHGEMHWLCKESDITKYQTMLTNLRERVKEHIDWDNNPMNPKNQHATISYVSNIH